MSGRVIEDTVQVSHKAKPKAGAKVESGPDRMWVRRGWTGWSGRLGGVGRQKSGNQGWGMGPGWGKRGKGRWETKQQGNEAGHSRQISFLFLV